MDILGLWGYVRANWNPGYGDTVIPFVFLARLNALAVIPFIAFFSVLSTGGDLAAQQAEPAHRLPARARGADPAVHDGDRVPGRRRDLGSGYLPPGLEASLRQPLVRRQGPC